MRVSRDVSREDMAVELDQHLRMIAVGCSRDVKLDSSSAAPSMVPITGGQGQERVHAMRRQGVVILVRDGIPFFCFRIFVRWSNSLVSPCFASFEHRLA